MVGGLGRFTTVVKLLAFSLLEFGISVACPAAAVKYLVDEGAKPLFYNVDEFMYGSELVYHPSRDSTAGFGGPASARSLCYSRFGSRLRSWPSARSGELRGSKTRLPW